MLMVLIYMRTFLLLCYNFVFSINTTVINYDTDIKRLSQDDIRHSFIEKINRHVGSHVNNQVFGMNGQCHVYSLPYQFKMHLLTTDACEGDVFDQ